jgi:hypothetical protein
MKIHINKKYRTRDGREVIIHAIDGPDKSLPVVASIRNPGGWMAGKWRADGIGTNESSSLIEVREPREFQLVVSTAANDIKPLGTLSAFRTERLAEGKTEHLDAPYWEIIRVREIID